MHSLVIVWLDKKGNAQKSLLGNHKNHYCQLQNCTGIKLTNNIHK